LVVPDTERIWTTISSFRVKLEWAMIVTFMSLFWIDVNKFVDVVDLQDVVELFKVG
jgi:hypothetical protein